MELQETEPQLNPWIQDYKGKQETEPQLNPWIQDYNGTTGY